ncbi:hypothetical protein FOXYS1_15160 [Fusarium oxysporum]|uniref:DUF6536 domain-containing protein n=1 Tax=Fusarium oxysporum TaxID=5507 RepID=A0A8H4ZH33_FUSOX|nr:hypothetical protein FOXYS1_15160 [Fusarium oxysporum]
MHLLVAKNPFSGWRRTGVYLTGLIATLTTLLIILLLVSLFHLDRDKPEDNIVRHAQDAVGQSILMEKDCATSAKANLWIHLTINIFSTGILASSNFFMQSLVAPRRAEVHTAHRSGRCLEIGAQSLRNFRFLGWRKILFWSLFCLSSVPLHLVFNGTVLESKGTNGSTVIIGSKELLKGGRHEETPIATSFNRWRSDKMLESLEFEMYESSESESSARRGDDDNKIISARWRDYDNERVKRIKPISESIAAEAFFKWEELPYTRLFDTGLET